MNRLNIRWRIALWNTAAFAVILLGFGLAVYGMLRKTHYDQVDRGLLAYFHDMEESDGAAMNAGRYSSYVVEGNGRIVAHTPTLSKADMVATALPSDDAQQFDTAYLPAAGHVRRLMARAPGAESERTVVLLAELEHVDEELWEVIRALLITAPITLVAAASIAYFLAYKAISPVDHLRKMTDEITAERLDRRLPVKNPSDELGLLAQTINSMIARLEQSFGEIRRFTADASHELRTPVSIIRSEAELGLAAGDCPDAVRKRLESIVEECSRLADLTTQLLALCREEAGLTQMTHVPVQLGLLVSESTESIRPLAESKQLQLTLEGDGDHPVVIGDADRLHRVIYNLLDNAIRHTPTGGHITVSLGAHNGNVQIEVRDSGVGIAPEHLPHLFERFYQIESSRSHGSGGAGLGLSIVKSIVEAHDGRVEVTSEPGKGSVFRIQLRNVPLANPKT